MTNFLLCGIMVFICLMMIRYAIQIKMIQKHGKCPRGTNHWHAHDWRHQGNWNSGFRSKFTGDVIARNGARCYNCGEWDWDESDEEFALIISDVVK